MGIVSEVTGEDTGITVHEYFRGYEERLTTEEDVEVAKRRNQLRELYLAYHASVSDLLAGVWDYAGYYKDLRELYSAERVEEFDRLLEEDLYFGEDSAYILPPKFSMHYAQEDIRLAEYLDTVHAILDNAKRMQMIGLFNDKDSFSYNNILRTAEDYRILESVTPVIEANYGTKSVFNYKYTVYFCLVAVLVVANCLAEEKQRGLISLLHLAPGGRGKLAAKQAGTLFLWSIIINVVFYGALVVQGVLTYGHSEAWFTPIQNLEQFAFLPVLWDKWQLLAMIVLFQTLAIYAIVMLFLTVSVAFRNHTITWIVLGAICLAEYIPYTLLKRTSAWAIFAHMNLFSLLKPGEIVSEYYNWGFGTMVIPRQMLYLGTIALLLLCLLPIYCLVLPRRKPVESEGHVVRLARRVEYTWNRWAEYLSGVGKESYKLLVAQRGFLVLVLVFVLAWNNRFQGTLPEPDYYQAEFYAAFQGKNADEAFDMYVAEQQQKRVDMQEEIDTLYRDYKAGAIGALEFSYAYGLSNELQKLSEFAMGLEQRQARYHALQEKGIIPRIIDERGYQQVFGEVFYDVENNYAMIAVMGILLLVIPLFAQEKQVGMVPILRASAGRSRLYRRKLLLLLAFTALIWFGITACDMSNVIKQFALSDYDAPVQSIGVLMNFECQISIGTFIVCFHIRKLLLLLAFAIGVSVIGECLSFRISLLVGTALLVPHLIYLCGVNAAAVGSVVIPIGGTELYGTMENHWWWIDVAYVVVCLLMWLFGHFRVIRRKRG